MNYYKIANDFFNKSCQMITFNNEEEWLKLRRDGIGGSDVASILGHSPFRNIKDIYKSKIEDVPQTSNEAIEFGNAFEPIVFETFKNKYKDIYEVLDYKNTMFRNIWNPFLQASLDGVLVNKQTLEVGILEIKTAQERKSKWYDNYGNKSVPLYYLDQAIHYFNTTNANYIVFYALINYKNSNIDKDLEFLTPRIYYRKDLEELCNKTFLECKNFWFNNVVKKVEPNVKLSFR